MSYSVEKKEIPAQTVAVSTGSGTMAEIPKVMGELLPRVMSHIRENGGQVAGPPFTEYLSLGETIELRTGMPLVDEIDGGDGVEIRELPGGAAVSVVHYGPYDKLHEAYAAIQAYMDEHGLTAGDTFWEYYWTDPGENPDPKDWKTEIFQPVQG